MRARRDRFLLDMRLTRPLRRSQSVVCALARPRNNSARDILVLRAARVRQFALRPRGTDGIASQLNNLPSEAPVSRPSYTWRSR